jgi:UDP-N-acetylmuramate dehydrogenase
MRIENDRSLRHYNTFGIDVLAKHFAEIATAEDFRALIAEPQLQEERKLLLGGGSNLLFTRDFDGLVIKNSLRGIEILREDADHVWVRASAGEVWHDFVTFCVDRNLAGLENLSLIPGLVGAAPLQNIGAYGVEMCETCVEVEAVQMSTGEGATFGNADCDFGYRDSVFKHRHRDEFLITAVTFRLSKTPSLVLSYGDLRRTLDEMRPVEVGIKAVSEAVIRIRSSKLPDPRVLGNAGSFFKNPVIPPEQFAALAARHPSMPHYPQANGQVKVPAGWLIEQCGWKGKAVGRAAVHRSHALVIVNLGGATGQEVQSLATQVQTSVREKFEIDIKPEVNFV